VDNVLSQLGTNCQMRSRGSRQSGYTHAMQRKIFWMTFAVLGLVADLFLPFWWAIIATFPILGFSWWLAYRSDWFA
jgi:hypothetical protein